MTYAALGSLKKNSVSTTTTADITALSTTIPVADTSVFFDKLGALITKGIELSPDNAIESLTEEITITGCSPASGPGAITGVSRGVNADGSIGAAHVWVAGTKVCVTISLGVYNQIKDNFIDIQANKIGGVTGATNMAILLANGVSSQTVKTSGKTITTVIGADDTTVPTSKAVIDWGGNSNNLYWFDVTAAPYNADKTGASDSTVAIQAAIDACEAQGGGVVFFPYGLYIISDTLLITEPVSLVGEGSDRTDFEIGSFTNYSTVPDGDWHERIYDYYPFDPTRSLSLIRWADDFITPPARGTMVRVMKTGVGAALGVHFAIGGMHWKDLAFDSRVMGGLVTPPFDVAAGPAYCLDFDLVQKSTFENIKIACIPGTAIRMWPRYNRSGVGTANIIAQNCTFNTFINIHISQVCRGILMDGTIAGTLDAVTGLWDGTTWSYGGNCCNNSFFGIGIRHGDGAPFGTNDGVHMLGTSLYNLCAYDGWFGKATAASSVSLTDSAANWDTANKWLKDCIVYIRGGTGLGSWGKITSNTASTITCSGGWFNSDGTAGTTPAVGDQYVIDTGTYAVKFNLADTNSFYRVWTEGANIVGGVPVHDIVWTGGNATHHDGFFGMYGTLRATNGTFNEVFDYQMNQGTPQFPSVENVTELYWDQPWVKWTAELANPAPGPVLVWYNAGGVMAGGLHTAPDVTYRYRMDHGIIHFTIDINGVDGSDATNLVITTPRPAFPQNALSPYKWIPTNAMSVVTATYYPLISVIISNGSNMNINFLNFQKLTDGTNFGIHISGSYEVQ